MTRVSDGLPTVTPLPTGALLATLGLTLTTAIVVVFPVLSVPRIVNESGVGCVWPAAVRM